MPSTLRDFSGRTSAGFLLLSAVLLSSACERGGSASPAAETPAGAPAEIDAQPLVSVGVLEGDTVQQFDRVVTPFLLPDGQLVVPLAGNNVIRVFAPDGEFVTSLGRSGEGPGEFGAVGSAWSRGDTIEAFDWRLMRITRFLPDGSTENVPLEGVERPHVAIAGSLDDGWITTSVADGGPGRRDSMVIHRFSRDGRHLGELAAVGGMRRYASPFGSGPEPLSPRALFALHDGRIYVAETLTPKIRVLERSGVLDREITWEPLERTSPEDASDLVLATALARAAPDEAASLRQRFTAAPMPEEVSVFWHFLVDEEGFIWLRAFDPVLNAAMFGGLGSAGRGGAGPGGEWSILAPDGSQAGSVQVPEEIEPFYITADRVVGIHRDELGVESVRVHALRRN